MPTEPRKRQLKMELDPNDAELLKHLVEALTTLVEGVEALGDTIDRLDVTVRAAVPAGPGEKS